MIRINLIGEKKKQSKKKSGGSSRVKLEGMGSGSSGLLVGILLVGVVAAGFWWWTLSKDLQSWNQQISDADQEIKRLEEIIKKGEEYEAKKALLARKIDLITDLKKQQGVPVYILDQVSKNLPEFLWLDRMSASTNEINISGKATNYNAVSNFYTNLSDSGFFSNVSLGRTFEVPEGVAFSLSCNFAGNPSSEEG
jgi:type IV pilus assembly protein PilN